MCFLCIIAEIHIDVVLLVFFTYFNHGMSLIPNYDTYFNHGMSLIPNYDINFSGFSLLLNYCFVKVNILFTEVLHSKLHVKSCIIS